MRILPLILAFVWPVTLPAGHFTFTPLCREAYREILSLRLEKGEQVLQKAAEEDPDNLMPVYLENYIDFFRLYISEDEALYYSIRDHKKERLRKLETGDRASPWYLFTQAGVHLQWAITRLKFQAYLTAFREVKQTRNLLELNTYLHPDFLPNRQYAAVLEAVAGAIPDEYKWGARILGLEGSVEAGIKNLEYLVGLDEAAFPFKKECLTLYAFLALHLQHDNRTAWEIVNRPEFNDPDNLLASFVKAHVAMYTGHNDAAVEILDHRPRGPEYIPFYFLDYMSGLARVRKLDPEAGRWFRLYLENYQGKNYLKECYQKLGWVALLQGDTAGYRHYMELCLSEGEAIVDPDKAAEAEAGWGFIPDITLLKARLLFDGGYYDQALQQLAGHRVEDFSSKHDQVEFTYRAGRIYHYLGDYEKALGYYFATIKNGAGEPWYFAANAALQSGLIYEAQGDYEKARYFYNKCLSMDEVEYKTSLDAQAKAGLNRIKEK